MTDMINPLFGKRRPLRLLVSDDASELRKRLREALADHPDARVVGEAADVPSTLEAIDRLRPDAVILDIQMPGGGGTEVLRQIGTTPDRPAFIVLTNHTDHPYRMACQKLGVQFFLDKSHDMDRLGEILSSLSSALGAGHVLSEVF
jgi:two-component system response regulator AlgR